MQVDITRMNSQVAFRSLGVYVENLDQKGGGTLATDLWSVVENVLFSARKLFPLLSNDLSHSKRGMNEVSTKTVFDFFCMHASRNDIFF